jgi:hypothetical protein
MFYIVKDELVLKEVAPNPKYTWEQGYPFTASNNRSIRYTTILDNINIVLSRFVSGRFGLEHLARFSAMSDVQPEDSDIKLDLFTELLRLVSQYLRNSVYKLHERDVATGLATSKCVSTFGTSFRYAVSASCSEKIFIDLGEFDRALDEIAGAGGSAIAYPESFDLMFKKFKSERINLFNAKRQNVLMNINRYSILGRFFSHISVNELNMFRKAFNMSGPRIFDFNTVSHIENGIDERGRTRNMMKITATLRPPSDDGITMYGAYEIQDIKAEPLHSSCVNIPNHSDLMDCHAENLARVYAQQASLTLSNSLAGQVNWVDNMKIAAKLKEKVDKGSHLTETQMKKLHECMSKCLETQRIHTLLHAMSLAGSAPSTYSNTGTKLRESNSLNIKERAEVVLRKVNSAMNQNNTPHYDGIKRELRGLGKLLRVNLPEDTKPSPLSSALQFPPEMLDPGYAAPDLRNASRTVNDIYTQYTQGLIPPTARAFHPATADEG